MYICQDYGVYGVLTAEKQNWSCIRIAGLCGSLAAISLSSASPPVTWMPHWPEPFVVPLTTCLFSAATQLNTQSEICAMAIEERTSKTANNSTALRVEFKSAVDVSFKAFPISNNVVAYLLLATL